MWVGEGRRPSTRDPGGNEYPLGTFQTPTSSGKGILTLRGGPLPDLLPVTRDYPTRVCPKTLLLQTTTPVTGLSEPTIAPFFLLIIITCGSYIVHNTTINVL